MKRFKNQQSLLIKSQALKEAVKNLNIIEDVNIKTPL